MTHTHLIEYLPYFCVIIQGVQALCIDIHIALNLIASIGYIIDAILSAIYAFVSCCENRRPSEQGKERRASLSIRLN